MGSARSRVGLVALLVALAAGLFFWFKGTQQPSPRSLGHFEKFTLTRLAPEDSAGALLYAGEWGPSPQLIKLDGAAPMLIVPASDGQVTALDPVTGDEIWQLALPRDPNHDAWAMADPVLVGDRMVFTYSWLPYDERPRSHHAAVIDLRRGVVDTSFPTITFAAAVKGADGALIRFDPQYQHARSALAQLSTKDGRRLVYSGFGAIRDQGIWHGWLFEIDLGAWRRTRGAKALSGVFLTTPVSDCSEERKDCGGGIWAYHGAQVRQTPAGGEILIQTGNGRLDLSTGSYAQSLIRLSPGLKFAPSCDMKICSAGNPRDPSTACLASCGNLFVPRLMPDDPPLDPVDGACRGVSFLKCLDINDWDFGAGSPTYYEADGRGFYVTASKAGGIYLLDAKHLGTMYDRKQSATLCGAPGSPCPAVYEGMTMAQPKIVRVGGQAIAVVRTFNMDDRSSAGVVGYAIVTKGKPHLTELWRTPARGSKAATQWFREPPTRMAISKVGGEPVAWIGDNAEPGRLLAIRVRDGKLLANVSTAGRPMRNARPLVYEDRVYLPTIDTKDKSKSRLEVYRIDPA